MREEKETLTLEDLQEQHREIAELIGMDGLMKLADVYGGTSLYIPQVRELMKNRVYKAILEEYDGTNIKQLSGKYQVSEATVYKILKDKIGNVQIPGQMSFADFGI